MKTLHTSLIQQGHSWREAKESNPTRLDLEACLRPARNPLKLAVPRGIEPLTSRRQREVFPLNDGTVIWRTPTGATSSITGGSRTTWIKGYAYILIEAPRVDSNHCLCAFRRKTALCQLSYSGIELAVALGLEPSAFGLTVRPLHPVGLATIE